MILFPVLINWQTTFVIATGLLLQPAVVSAIDLRKSQHLTPIASYFQSPSKTWKPEQFLPRYCCYWSYLCFSLRAHKERDICNHTRLYILLYFDPRARKERDKSSGIYPNSDMFQSTRPQGARPFSIFLHSLQPVSIHAPARSATKRQSQLQLPVQFQSTRPQGARRLFKYTNYGLNVSIHAPARSATPKIMPGSNGLGFNPRARKERDLVMAD